MPKGDHRARIVIEERIDGYVIVGEEAWFLEDYDRWCYECEICETRFMLMDQDAKTIGGRPPKYCSEECVRISVRRKQADYQRRVRTATPKEPTNAINP